MTTINGKLNGSITGKVTFTPDHSFVDTSTDPDTLIINPISADIANSEFTINVPQSENIAGGSTTYEVVIQERETVVKFYLSSGEEYTGLYHQHTDNEYYTGAVNSPSSELLTRVESYEYKDIQSPLHTTVPETSPVDFTSLIGGVFVSPYDSQSLYRIADILTNEAIYRDRISSKLTIRGDYDAGTVYQPGDIIAFNGNGYAYRPNTPGSGNAPDDTTSNQYWLLIAEKGAAGGTGAQIVGYTPSTWRSSTEAAARADVVDAIDSIPNPDLSTYLLKSEGLPRNNPVMTGSAKRSELAYPVSAGNLNTEIPTTKYIEEAIAASGSSFLPKPIIWARRTSNQLVCASGSSNGDVVVNWDDVALGAAQVNSGVITIPEAGNYLIGVSLHMRAQANSSQTGKDMMFRCYAQRGGSDICELFRNYGKAYYTGYEELQTFGLYYLHQLNQLDSLTVRANIRYYNASAFGASSSILGGLQRNYLLLWRVSD